MRLADWIAKLDLDTAKKIHSAYNAASLSGLELAEAVAVANARTKGTGPAARKQLRIVRDAVTAVAAADTSTAWHGAWPMVSAAADCAVWGLLSSSPEHCRETLTGPVRAAGFSGGL